MLDSDEKGGTIVVVVLRCIKSTAALGSPMSGYSFTDDKVDQEEEIDVPLLTGAFFSLSLLLWQLTIRHVGVFALRCPLEAHPVHPRRGRALYKTGWPARLYLLRWVVARQRMSRASWVQRVLVPHRPVSRRGSMRLEGKCLTLGR